MQKHDNKKSKRSVKYSPKTDAERHRQPIDKEERSAEDRIEGRNPVMEALKSDREIDKILVQQGERHGSIVKIIAFAKEKKIVVQEVARQKLDALSAIGNHQGIIAFAAMHQYVEIDEILSKAAKKEEPPFVIIAEEITDPHNLGSILRTANAAGAHGVIISKRRSVGLTAAVAKASAGAVEYVPVAKVTNLSRTIEQLKKQGIWIVGTDTQGEQYLYQADLKGPIGLVIGSEGKGMSRLVKEKCDFLIKIPMKGEIDSLNASVAGGVVMYEVLRQRGE